MLWQQGLSDQTRLACHKEIWSECSGGDSGMTSVIWRDLMGAEDFSALPATMPENRLIM